MKVDNIKTKGPHMSKERRIAFNRLMELFCKTEVAEELRLKVLKELHGPLND